MANKRNDILNAAEREFVSQGFAGARIMAIAHEAGVTHAMLHYYFNSKQHLFQEVLLSKIELFLQSVSLDFQLEGYSSVDDLILDVASQHFDFLKANPELPRFVFTNITHAEAVSVALKRVAPLLMQKLKYLDTLLAREHKSIDAVTLFQDVAMLNMSAFLMLPVVEQTGADTKSFLQQRKDEMLLLLKNRLLLKRHTTL